jgi:hypothetical protein
MWELFEPRFDTERYLGPSVRAQRCRVRGTSPSSVAAASPTCELGEQVPYPDFLPELEEVPYEDRRSVRRAPPLADLRVPRCRDRELKLGRFAPLTGCTCGPGCPGSPGRRLVGELRSTGVAGGDRMGVMSLNCNRCPSRGGREDA